MLTSSATSQVTSLATQFRFTLPKTLYLIPNLRNVLVWLRKFLAVTRE
jgi:hypothetical protein